MTTPITKEQLQRIIESADEILSALAGTNDDVNPDNSTKMCGLWDDLNDRHAPPEVVRELACIALAAMDAEPVGEFYHEARWGWYEISEGDKVPDNRRIPLYAAPPAPVVPEVLDRLRSIVADPRALPRRKEWISGQQYSYVLLENVDAMVDEACCAAMLQSFGNPEQLEPVSQPYKLPPNSFTDAELEMMSHGDNPQANAYRELLAFRRNSPVIPDGWKLVPLTAFPSQWAAGQKAFDSAGMNKVDAVYKAMVVAAPPAP